MAQVERAPGASAGRWRGPAEEESKAEVPKSTSSGSKVFSIPAPEDRLYISLNGWPGFKHFCKSAIQFVAPPFSGFVWLPVDHEGEPIIIREFRDMEVEVRCAWFNVHVPALARDRLRPKCLADQRRSRGRPFGRRHTRRRED